MGKKWYIVGTVATLCLCGTAAFVYSACVTAPPANSTQFAEAVKSFFLCLGGMGVLIPITLNVMNSVEQRRFDRIENTFDLVSGWDDSHLLAARNYTRKIRKDKPNIADSALIAQIEADEGLEQSVILVTNYFESVRYSILANRIDVAHFKASLGQTVIQIINRFWPFYEKQGQAVCDDLNQLKEMLK